MATWMPATKGLASKREVLTIAATTGEHRYAVVGRLIDFWGWVTEQTADGALPGVTIAMLSTLFDASAEFWQAMVDVGWLEVREDGIAIPRFEIYLSQSAGERLKNAARQRVSRISRDKSATKARHRRDESATRLEETTQEESPEGPNQENLGGGAGGEPRSGEWGAGSEEQTPRTPHTTPIAESDLAAILGPVYRKLRFRPGDDDCVLRKLGVLAARGRLPPAWIYGAAQATLDKLGAEHPRRMGYFLRLVRSTLEESGGEWEPMLADTKAPKPFLSHAPPKELRVVAETLTPPTRKERA